MKLKICGNTNPDNIQAIMPLAPDYLGFIFHPGSPRYIGKNEDIRCFIASQSGVLKTGVFVNASLIDVRIQAKAYRLDLAQLHGSESPEYCRSVARTMPVIKAFGISDRFDFDLTHAYQNSCRYFLFDTDCAGYGGSGQSFDWSLLQRYKGNTPFFLSGGIGPEHVPVIKSIRHELLMGVDVNSRFESAPGIKNFHCLKTFSHALRN